MEEATDAAVTLPALLAIAALVLAAAALVLVVRLRRPDGADPVSGARQIELERRVAHVTQRLDVLEEDVDEGRDRSANGESDVVERVVRRTGPALSHVGLVRFDAFEDTGGGQSFALALIDDDGDGVILTSLHSRQATRLYAKGIRGGAADLPLSGEEEQALREAGLAP